MMNILKIKNKEGKWVGVPAIQGPPGSQGERGPSGVYVGHNPPDEALVWIEPDGTPDTHVGDADMVWHDF